jgi:4-hydroxy-2-oxoheptanedioate aldolase
VIHNATRAKLQAGGVAVGCFLPFPDANLAEYLSLLGWDFLVFDGEHGPIAAAEFHDLSRAAELRGATPIARVATNQAHLILQALDSGAHGVHVPWVNTSDEAEAVVRSAKYVPEGVRGLAGVRAADWGLSEPLGDYIRRANRETLVVIHVETAVAVDAIDELVAVDGVDVLFIGPSDLSHSLGVAGQIEHPTMRTALDRVAESVLGSDKALGIMAKSPAMAMRWRDRGATYITTSLDALIAPDARGYLSALRE